MGMDGVPAPTGSGDTARPDPKLLTPLAARRAGEEFEALFLSQMLAPMFESLESDALWGGPGGAIYRSLLVQEYGKAVARSGGFGLADSVAREILMLQEAQ